MPGEWKAQLSDDLKENEAFGPYETLNDFAKGHLNTLGKVTELDGNAETLKGKVTDLEGKLVNSIPKLADDASDEDRATFFSKIGRPDKPEEYEFKKPDLPEGITYDENQEKEFRNSCHAVGLTKAQASGIYDNFNQYTIKYFQALEAKRKQTRDETEMKLKADWGDKYKENEEISKRAMNALGVEEFVTFMDESGLRDNPIIKKTFYNIGTKIVEDSSLKGSGPEGGKKTTAQVLYPDQEK